MLSFDHPPWKTALQEAGTADPPALSQDFGRGQKHQMKHKI